MIANDNRKYNYSLANLSTETIFTDVPSGNCFVCVEIAEYFFLVVGVIVDGLPGRVRGDKGFTDTPAYE